MSFKTASAILRGGWLINKGYVQSNMDMIMDLRKGKSVDFGLTEREEETLNQVLNERGVVMTSSTRYYQVGMYSQLDNVAPGSIAVVNLLGPVLKYGDMCSYGMVDKANLLQRVAMSGNFKAIVLNVDSPGGQADGTQLFADTIKHIRANFGMKVIAVVDDGMMASAAMWIGASCDEIYATKVTDTFGSIGVYMTIVDFRQYLEGMGITMRDVYAEQSVDKNRSYKEALDGKDELLLEDLNFLADTFISSVKEDRGDRLNTATENPFTGKMYPAQKALEIGLIDGIIPFDEVLARADHPDNDYSKISNQNNMFGKNKFSSLTALVGVAAANVTATHVAAINAQVESENIAGITVALDSDLAIAETAVTENTNALAALNGILGEGNHKATLGEAITAVSAAHTTLGTERDDFKAKAEEFGAKPGADQTTGAKEGTDVVEIEAETVGTYSQADADLKEARAAAGIKPKNKR
jgi:protease-4